MHGVIVVTEGGAARSGPGKESRTDYPVMDVHMAHATQEARPNEKVAYHPHRPAVVHFADRPAEVRYLALDSLPDIPRCRFDGPRQLNDQVWDGYKECVDVVLGGDTARQLGKNQISSVHGQWANRADLDLTGVTTAKIKAGRRSKQPRTFENTVVKSLAWQEAQRARHLAWAKQKVGDLIKIRAFLKEKVGLEPKQVVAGNKPE